MSGLKFITRNIKGIEMTLPEWSANTPEDELYEEYVRVTNNQKKIDEYQRQHKQRCREWIHKKNKQVERDFINYVYRARSNEVGAHPALRGNVSPDGFIDE
jgi:sarcosine oxidase delta subunit